MSPRLRSILCLCLLAFPLPCFSQADTFYKKLVMAAVERTTYEEDYDPSYYTIDFPDGDIPANKGVCTDLIIRAYRKTGIDLQVEVNKDMSENFSSYPGIWGLSAPDPNIDHRRVPNLIRFFERKGKCLPVSNDWADYSPGDIVAWDLGNGITHIGIVTDLRNSTGTGYLIAHNIGYGPELEDMLFTYRIIGHYRYGEMHGRESR